MDCHRRIERFLGALVKVTERASGREMNPMERRDLLNALEYFRNAAPRHTADEEESLFPRLRSIGGQKVEAALDDVARLHAEHVRADALHAEVDEIGRRWLENQTLSEEETARLRDDLAELTRLYGPHLALEDRHLFPIAADVLTQSDLSEMGAEMAKRRGLDKSRVLI